MFVRAIKQAHFLVTDGNVNKNEEFLSLYRVLTSLSTVIPLLRITLKGKSCKKKKGFIHNDVQ